LLQKVDLDGHFKKPTTNLLNRKNNINDPCNDDLHRPLEIACSVDADVEIVDTLLKLGANVNFHFPSGARALQLSVMMNNIEQVECLLKGIEYFKVNSKILNVYRATQAVQM
jgi:ankyrin repeat protein